MRIIALISLLVLSACAGKSPIDLSKLPPIIIQIPPEKPAPKPEPSDPPPVSPTPAPPTEPAPEPAEPVDDRPLVNLNIVVHDATGAGIPSAECSISGSTERGQVETRTADGGGFINFPVRGSVKAACMAAGFVAAARELPPGDHRFPLVSVAPPEPPKPTADDACGSSRNRNGVSNECLAAVAKTSAFYSTCQITGNTEACHHYVREVVKTLNKTTGNPRWGLLKKTKGGDNVGGYGTDIIAYLPERFNLTETTWQWLGVDVIGGIGEPGARYVGGNFRPVVSCDVPRDQWPDPNWCQRSADIWTPVP